MKNNDSKKYKTSLDKWIDEIFQKIYNKIGIAGSIFFGLIALILLIILFVRLISNNYWEWINFNLSEKNEAGDALGGLTAPFIGITGVILTFLAFWVQYKFNQKQSEFYKRDKFDNTTSENLKLLEIISSRDKTTNFDIVNVCLNVCLNMIDDYEKDSLRKMDYIFIDSYKYYFLKNYNEYFTSSVEMSNKRELVQNTLNIYRDFNSAMDMMLSDFNKYNLSKADKYNLIEKYYNRFKLIYDGYEDNTCFIFTYFVSLLNRNEIIIEYLDMIITCDEIKMKLKEIAIKYYNKTLNN